MTNQERAADVIDRWTKDGSELNSAVGSPHEIATLLADAGLLMPDLPEPSEEVIWYEDSGVWRDSFEVWASEYHGTIEISGMGQPQIHIPIDRAEHLALCIIAAAKLAEENN